MKLLEELNKRFTRLSEKTDFIDDAEAAMDYEDLPDQDIDNDGDTDESDEYLHNKLGVVAKKVNESSTDLITFSVDDEKLDQLLHDFHGRELDYVNDKKDILYTLPRREFDRFIDAADSKGFDVDYNESDRSVIYVMEEMGLADIEEANVTANLDGGAGPMRTPRAFGKKEDERGSAEKLGMKKTQKSNRHYRKMESRSSYKTMMAEMYGVGKVNEASNPQLDKMVDRFVKGLSTKYGYGTSDATMALFDALKRLGYIHRSVDYVAPSGFSVEESVSYREYKKDPNASPQQKVNKGIAEINSMLAEIERMVHNNVRLKQEMGVNSSHFWKATGTRFAKINERMTRISNRLRELSK